MREIHHVFATVPYEGSHLERLREIFAPARVVCVSPADAEEELAHADVAVLRSDGDTRLLRAPRMRWIHCDQAGLDRFAKPEVFQRNLIVTSSAGRSGPVLAEHALFFMLNLAYGAHSFSSAQKRKRWGFPGVNALRGLCGRTVLILGLGHTGQALALRATALGMNVLGYRRRNIDSPGVHRLFCGERGDSLEEPLGIADFVIIALPLTDRTHHLLGEREFGLMKSGAFLVNVGRGAVVDEAALLDALDRGSFGGAGLDVFVREPLPRKSPLWSHPKVMITPHVTPQMPDRTGRSLDILAENVRRYRSGEPMLNQLTPDDVYTKGYSVWKEPAYRAFIRKIVPAKVRSMGRDGVWRR